MGKVLISAANVDGRMPYRYVATHAPSTFILFWFMSSTRHYLFLKKKIVDQ